MKATISSNQNDLVNCALQQTVTCKESSKEETHTSPENANIVLSGYMFVNNALSI